MNKLMALCVALAMSAGFALAQSSFGGPVGGAVRDSGRVRLSVDQKAQIITDRMAKAYDLSAERKAKLLELNRNTIRHRSNYMRAQRQHMKNAGMHMNCGNKPCVYGNDKKFGKCGDKKCKFAKEGKKKVHGHARANAKFANNGMANPRFADNNGPRAHRHGFGYYKALKEILTEEQFNAYRLDKAIERSMLQPMAQRGRYNRNMGWKHGFGPRCGEWKNKPYRCCGAEQKNCKSQCGNVCCKGAKAADKCQNKKTNKYKQKGKNKK